MLANCSNNVLKKVIPSDQVRFILGMQGYFNIANQLTYQQSKKEKSHINIKGYR